MALAAVMPKEAGVWLDDSGEGAVKIEPCGSKLCGKIVWLKDPLNAKGEQKSDKYNPDPSLRTRPICGLPTLGELEALPEGGFDGGWVYDPKEGKSYSVAITIAGPNQLQVTGYKGLRFLGKSFIWTRAKPDLPLCNTQPAAITAPGAPAKAAATAPAAGAKPAATATQPAKPAAAVKQTGEKLPWGDATKAPVKAAPAGATNLGSSQTNPSKAKAATADQ